MRSARLRLAVLCVCGGVVLSASQKGRAVAGVNRVLPMAGAATVGTVTASPATISFTATDPDLGAVSGNSAGIVHWTTTNGSGSSTWNLSVRSTASSFANCGTAPASAVTVQCGSVTGGTGGSCKPGFKLTTSNQVIASGNESTGANANYWTSVTFTFTDSWSYIARQTPSCSLSLTYTVTAR